jgi:hypothetical protein
MGGTPIGPFKHQVRVLASARPPSFPKSPFNVSMAHYFRALTLQGVAKKSVLLLDGGDELRRRNDPLSKRAHNCDASYPNSPYGSKCSELNSSDVVDHYH